MAEVLSQQCLVEPASDLSQPPLIDVPAIKRRQNPVDYDGRDSGMHDLGARRRTHLVLSPLDNGRNSEG